MGRKKCHCLCFVIYRCQGKGNAPLGVEKKAFDAIDVITLLTFRYYTHAHSIFLVLVLLASLL